MCKKFIYPCLFGPLSPALSTFGSGCTTFSTGSGETEFLDMPKVFPEEYSQPALACDEAIKSGWLLCQTAFEAVPRLKKKKVSKYLI